MIKKVNQAYLPSKKFVRIVGSGALLVLALYLGSYGVEYISRFKKNPKTDVSAFLDAYEEAERDTDADGLKDWEEILWKSDLSTADTDGDGANDGEEVKTGRNPVVSGTEKNGVFSDALKKPQEMTGGAQGAGKTVTEKIAQEFAQQYFVGKGVAAEELLGSESQQAIADALVRTIAQGAAAYGAVFEKSDIAISDSTAPKTYINGVGKMLKENFVGIEVSELAIMESILESKDFSQVELFDHFISAYEKTVSFLRKTSVPAPYADAHLQLLNGMQNTLFAVRDMRHIERDPARAIIGIQRYLTESDRSREYLLLFKNRVAADNIAFAAEEPGTFFVRYFSKL